MAQNGRLEELLADLIIEMKGMRNDINSRLDGLNNRVDGLNDRVDGLNDRVGRLEEQQSKTNLAIGELRLSFMNLSDKLTIVADLERRVDALEHKVNK